MALSSNDLADLMEKELKTIYQNKKGIPLPETGLEDRQILFKAIARGILKHLETQQASTLRTITLNVSGIIREYNVARVDFNIPEFEP